MLIRYQVQGQNFVRHPMNRSQLFRPAQVPVFSLMVLAACTGGDEPHVSVSSSGAPPECAAREGGSRWGSREGEYREVAEYGEGPEHWLEEVSGLAVRDSLVFVYDAGRARITALSSHLHPVRYFGRQGKGPGELNRERNPGGRGTWQRLEVVDDRVAVFDGSRIQFFDASGTSPVERFQGAVRSGAVNPETDRLRYWKDYLLAASGGYQLPFWQRAPRPNRWELVRWDQRRHQAVLSLQLTPLPTTANRVSFLGPDQAQPLWDAARGCVIATDGTGRWLVRGNIHGTHVDTLGLTIPNLGRPPTDEDEMARLLGVASRGAGRVAAPTALRRIDGIRIDPDGFAWILPVQNSGSRGTIEVIRVSLQTGAAERDTVPAFPEAFGAPGVYYAQTRSGMEPRLVRYDLHAQVEAEAK